jgi:hypothetical protein
VTRQMDISETRSDGNAAVAAKDVLLDEIAAFHPRRSSFAFPLPHEIIPTLLIGAPPTVVHLSRLSDGDGDILRKAGLSEQFVHDLSTDSNLREAALRSEYTGGVQFAPRSYNEFEEALFRKSFVRDASYVDTIFSFGGMLVRDPFTGTVVKSSHSFLIDDYHVAFRFESVEAFYVMVGQTYGHRIALLVPRLRLVVVFQQALESPALLAWIVKCSDRLIELLLQEREGLSAVLSRPSLGGAVQIGFRQNLGHYVWQELQGIADLLSAHGAEAIGQLILGPYRPFDPRELFPELSDTPVTEVRDSRHPFAATFRLPYQPVRPVGLRIGRELRRRIQLAVDRKISNDVRQSVEELTRSRFCIWINLRHHNKAWKQQVPGTIDVMNRLHQIIPDLAIVFDGFSDTKAICSEIVNGLNPGIEVRDTIGCSLEESLVWARSVHLYSSVVGSGLIINSWLSRKPGVAHANVAHLRQASFWSLVAEDAIAPQFLSPEAVTDDETMYGSYDFDAALLLGSLTSLARQFYPERVKDA